MSIPKYVITVTLSIHEANLVLAGLLRGRVAMGECILDGENQGMSENQLQALRRSREVSLELSRRLVASMR